MTAGTGVRESRERGGVRTPSPSPASPGGLSADSGVPMSCGGGGGHRDTHATTDFKKFTQGRPQRRKGRKSATKLTVLSNIPFPLAARRRLPESSGRLFKELAVVTAPRLRALEELDDRFQVGEGRHGVAALVPHHLVRVGWGFGFGWRVRVGVRVRVALG